MTIPARPDTWVADDDLSPAQLSLLDRLWQAQRYDGVSAEIAAEIEAQTRRGDLWHASRALSRARRNAAHH